MGVFDKIKNALFEEEYVEVEEKPKKQKKSKIKEEKNDSPIAKKVVLPEKKEKIEELEEEELDSNDYEFRPKDDIDKNELMDKRKDFRIMDDDDFKVDEDESITDDGEELKIVPVVEEEKQKDEIEVIGNDNYIVSDDDFPFKDKDDRFNANDYSDSWNDNYKEKKSYVEDLNNSTENLRNNYTYPSTSTSSRGLYGIDNSNKITMHEYGTYERKEEKTYFKPSPIISPIYGILDKNYKKEDVVQKREVRPASFERDKVSIDDVRKKAYGSITDELEREFIDDIDGESFEVEEKNEDEAVMVDLNDEKPTVKEVTMGDAVEYFEDLGLEYNVDYVDDSKKQVEEEVKEEPTIEEVKPKEKKTKKIVEEKEPEEKVVPERKTKEVEPVEEDKEEIDKSEDENLFDLIDSMYQE